MAGIQDNRCGNGAAWNPFGFSLKENGIRENFGQFGMEVTVTFIGPAIYRMQFLSNLFGEWGVNCSGATGYCSSGYTFSGHCPYVYSLVNNAVGSHVTGALSGFTGDSNIGGHLVPDTFSTAYVCGSPVSRNLFPSENKTVVGPDGNTHAGQHFCSSEYFAGDCVEVTVTFRRKSRDWPDWLRCQCNDSPSIDDPVVPVGTFVRVTPKVEFQTLITEGNGWQSRATGNPLEGNVGFPIQVKILTLDVVWENVPSPNVRALCDMSGKVNCNPVFGFPPDSVLFVYRDLLERPTWNARRLLLSGGTDIGQVDHLSAVHDVRFSLIVKTVDAGVLEIPESQRSACNTLAQLQATSSACPGHACEEDQGIADRPDGSRFLDGCNQLGVWNRTWFRDTQPLCGTPCEGTDTSTCPDQSCCSHWHLVQPTPCDGNGCDVPETVFDQGLPFARVNFDQDMLYGLGGVCVV